MTVPVPEPTVEDLAAAAQAAEQAAVVQLLAEGRLEQFHLETVSLYPIDSAEAKRMGLPEPQVGLALVGRLPSGVQKHYSTTIAPQLAEQLVQALPGTIMEAAGMGGLVTAASMAEAEQVARRAAAADSLRR